MSWNYRVLKKEYKEEVYYFIHEVYYEKDGSIRVWSVDAMNPGGATLGELASDLGMMQEALKKPILREITKNGKETLVEIEE